MKLEDVKKVVLDKNEEFKLADKKFGLVLDYYCSFCGRTFPSEEHMDLHLNECLMNYEDNHTCVGCKHCVINQVPPTGKSSGYTSSRLLEMLGNKNFISCDIEHYSGKLSEEKLLQEKGCFEPTTKESEWNVNQTDAYKKYIGLINDAIKEEAEIEEELRELRKDAIELSDEDFDKKYSE